MDGISYCEQGNRCDNCPARNLPDDVRRAIAGTIVRIQGRPKKYQHTVTVPIVAALHALREDAEIADPSTPQVQGIAKAAARILFQKCSTQDAPKEENNDQ